MNYEGLLVEADQEDVEVIEMNLTKRTKGLYADTTVAINKNIPTTTEKACILAEELGHYYTSSGNIIDLTKTENIKQEKRARNWGYERLIPLEKFYEAYQYGCRNRFEISEYLGVTEAFLSEALIHYQEKYGLYHHFKNYYLCFNPLGIIEIFE